MSRPDPEAIEELLSRRRALLERVRQGPVPKPVLVEELAISRSTVDRAVRELEETRLLYRGGDGLELTLPGRVALDHYQYFQALLADLVRSTEVLAMLPADAPFDPTLIYDATVVDPEPYEPRRPVKRLLRDVRDARRIRAVGVAYVPEAVEAIFERCADADLDAELVVTGNVLDVMVQDCSDVIDEALAGGLDLYRTDVDEASYCMMLADADAATTVSVTVSSDGAVGGLIRNDSEDAVSWASHRFEHLRGDADPVGE